MEKESVARKQTTNKQVPKGTLQVPRKNTTATTMLSTSDPLNTLDMGVKSPPTFISPAQAGQRSAVVVGSHRENSKEEYVAKKSRIIINYDVGFENSLYLRGSGAGLSWDKGVPCKNIAGNQWMWLTEHPFDHCSFKILINDKAFEEGENRTLHHGETLEYTPTF